MNAFNRNEQSVEERLASLDLIIREANMVREKDRLIIESLLGNFYGKRLGVGMGFRRAFGSLLSGDYFNLLKLPDGNYLFVIADISGHGLMAYTILIRLNSAIMLAIGEAGGEFRKSGVLDPQKLVSCISRKFTDIMEANDLEDFASVLFTFIYNDSDKFHLRFYNRGMLFPIIVRKFRETPIDIYDLNLTEKGWVPVKGHLMSGVLRKLLDERYDQTPSCQFTIYEGDRVMFFTDGIVEASRGDDEREEFGIHRVRSILSDNLGLPPQKTVDLLFDSVLSFLGDPRKQEDDMTAIIIDFPPVR